MKIGFAILLNNECHNYIRRIQLELHEEFGFRMPRQAPHITIKSPFDTDDLDSFVEYLEALAKTVEPFEIEFDGLNYFGELVLFLDVKKNKRLTELHGKILDDLQDRFELEPEPLEGEKMKFHASIMSFGHEAEYEWTREYLQSYHPRFTFTARTFGLFYYLGEGNGWIVHRKVDFAN